VRAAALLVTLIGVAFPQSASEWQRAQSALKSGSYAEAESGFRKFLQESPSVGEGHVNLGLALHLQKKHREAIQSFRRAIELQPQLGHAYLFLGIDLFNLNNTTDAMAALEHYTGVAPRDPQGHYYLGLCFASRGETAQAMAEFEVATELAPRDVDMLYHLAQSYIAQANTIVRRVAEHDPSLSLLKNWEQMQQTGMEDSIRRSSIAGADKMTLESVRGRLGRTPPDLEAEQLAAAAYANLYLQATRRFVALEPQSFRVHQLLAAYYEKTGQIDKAVEELQLIVEQRVNARGVHFALGSIYKDQHKHELAAKEFQQELKVASPEPETRLQLAQVYLFLQRPQDALSELEIARQQLGEKNGNYWRTLGKVYTAADRHEDSVISYEKALAIGPADRALLYQLGQAYRRIGKQELARKMLAASNEAAKAEQAREQARTERAISTQQKNRTEQ
jgi:tetratricopeptide (TPR) repeat protein